MNKLDELKEQLRKQQEKSNRRIKGLRDKVNALYFTNMELTQANINLCSLFTKHNLLTSLATYPCKCEDGAEQWCASCSAQDMLTGAGYTFNPVEKKEEPKIIIPGS